MRTTSLTLCLLALSFVLAAREVHSAENGTPDRTLKIGSSFSVMTQDVKFSGDGKLLIAGGSMTLKHGMLNVWDAETHKKIAAVEPEQAINCVSLTPDNKYVVFGTQGGVVFWDVAARKTAFQLAHGRQVKCLAVSADGRLLVSGAVEKEEIFSPRSIKVWDIQTKKEVHNIADAGPQFALSQRDNTVAVMKTDGVLKMFNIATGKDVEGAEFQFQEQVEGEDKGFSVYGVRKMSFSPDGKHLAAAFLNFLDDDSVVIVWDRSSGKQKYTKKLTDWHINSLAFSPDGSLLAAGAFGGQYGTGGRIDLWSTDSGKKVATISKGTWIVFSVAFSPDGKQVVANRYPGVGFWDIDKLQKP